VLAVESELWTPPTAGPRRRDVLRLAETGSPSPSACPARALAHSVPAANNPDPQLGHPELLSLDDIFVQELEPRFEFLVAAPCAFGEDAERCPISAAEAECILACGGF
jgi:hypothetical protein